MDSYWKDREEQAQAEYALTDEQYVEQLNDIYDYMLDQVKKEVNGFYSKYATTEGITMAEAQKRVAQVDIDEYERKAKKYVAEKDFSDQANREMRLYNLTMKVNRLQMLEANIGLETVSGFDELSEKLGEDLTERALQEMTRQAGILGATVQNNAKTANSIVGASFHNATFSDRIWMYQAQLRDELDGLLRNGLIQGQNPNELARHINNLFDTGKYNCERLLRTELTRVQSDAQLQSFIAAGFDEYQFNALGNACPACRELDEQHFRIADAEPGENLPPIHPNCRCAVSAYMDDASYNEWLDSYADHGMSYEDWLENRPTAVEAGAETSKLKYKEAKTLKEAEALAKSCGVDNVDYKGIDLKVANEMNRALVDGMNRYPVLKDRIKWYASGQAMNQDLKAALTECLYKDYLERGMPDDNVTKKAAASNASKIVGRIPSRSYAFSRSGNYYSGTQEMQDIIYDYRGVGANTAQAKSYSKLSESLKEDIETQYHPVGTEEVRSIFDHEIGHQLDYAYGLSGSEEIRSIYESATREDIKNGLSSYANDSIAEFIAEAYSEYINNSEPREYAQQVGAIIDRKAGAQ